jgi:hypothetical protein
MSSKFANLCGNFADWLWKKGSELDKKAAEYICWLEHKPTDYHYMVTL